MSKIKIYASSGHGGSDPGAVSGGLKEKDLNLKISNYFTAYLRANGNFEVKQDKTTDLSKSIATKVKEANDWGADAAFDFHMNAGKGNGYESFNTIHESVSQGDEIAEAIEKEVIAIGQQSRGTKTKVNADKQDYFGFIRLTDMPGLILEGAFIDNPTDIKDFDSNAELKKLAEAYAKGVVKYYKKENVTPSVPSVNTKTYTVKKGDSLSSIAKQYNTTWQQLYNANKSIIGAKPELIFAGQKLIIPSGSVATRFNYTVKKGDTLSAIASKYGTTVEKLYADNKKTIGSNKNLIKPGQVLVI